jgi:hypothetical protein
MFDDQHLPHSNPDEKAFPKLWRRFSGLGRYVYLSPDGDAPRASGRMWKNTNKIKGLWTCN